MSCPIAFYYYRAKSASDRTLQSGRRIHEGVTGVRSFVPLLAAVTVLAAVLTSQGDDRFRDSQTGGWLVGCEWGLHRIGKNSIRFPISSAVMTFAISSRSLIA